MQPKINNFIVFNILLRPCLQQCLVLLQHLTSQQQSPRNALVQLFTIAASRSPTTGDRLGATIQIWARPIGATIVLIGLGVCLLGACLSPHMTTT